jgi:PilZ domain
MQAGVSLARRTRAQHRHELHTLTYVTLDQSNGGIVRDLTHAGIAVQAVAPVRAGEQVQVRFELRSPRLMIATRGEVAWGTASGQCGIRFLDLSPRATRQIDEWILGSLLAGLPPWLGPDDSSFATKTLALVGAGNEVEENDGLMVSASPVNVIELPLPAEPHASAHIHDDSGELFVQPSSELDWLSQPLSGRGLAWTINTLAVLAALFLFALVFLSVTRELPQRPFAIAVGAAGFVAALYWGLFKVFGGGSLGARLARLRESENEEQPSGPRFR